MTSGEQANGDDVSDDSDTATIGASDADAESGTETEDYEQGKRMSRGSFYVSYNTSICIRLVDTINSHCLLSANQRRDRVVHG